MLIDWKLIHSPPQFLNKEVHVWRANLKTNSQKLEEMWNLLLDEEKKWASNFISTQAKETFIVSRGILRLLLSKYLETAPEKLILKKGGYGKPYVQIDATKQLSLQFNISHSRDFALFAFALHNKIGVDIEFIQKNFVYEEIAQQFFSKQENIILSTLPKKQQRKAFFDCWARKEAFIKAVGEGLSFPLDEFDVDLLTNKENQPLPIRIHNKQISNKTFSLFALYPDRNHVAALVIDTLPCKIYRWEYQ